MYTRKINQLRALSARAETHSKGQTCWTKWRHIPVVLTGLSISYINASLTLSVGSSVEDNSLKWWIDHRPGHRHWLDVQRPNPNETKAAPDKGICFSEHPTISSLQKEGPEEFLAMTTLDFNMLLQFPMERQTWWTAVDDIQPTSPSEVFLAVNFPLSVWISHDLSGTHIAICEEGKRQCLQKSVPRINIETKFPKFSNGAGFRVRMGVPDEVITKTSEVVRIPKLNTDCKEVRRYAISCRVLYSKNVLEMLLWETRIKGFDMNFHCRNGSYVWCLFCVTLPWLNVKIIKHYSYSSK